MLSTLLDCFCLASSFSRADAHDLVPQLLALTIATSSRPLRAALAASAHVLARPDFLRAVYGDWDAPASVEGPAAAAELAKAEWQLIHVFTSTQCHEHLHTSVRHEFMSASS